MKPNQTNPVRVGSSKGKMYTNLTSASRSRKVVPININLQCIYPKVSFQISILVVLKMNVYLQKQVFVSNSTLNYAMEKFIVSSTIRVGFS